MANLLLQKPILIDTVMGASWRNTPNFLGCPPLYPRLIYWFDPASTGDIFTIMDTVRNLVGLEGRCENPGQSQVFPLAGVAWADFQVTALGSGRLEIWYS